MTCSTDNWPSNRQPRLTCGFGTTAGSVDAGAWCDGGGLARGLRAAATVAAIQPWAVDSMNVVYTGYPGHGWMIAPTAMVPMLIVVG